MTYWEDKYNVKALADECYPQVSLKDESLGRMDATHAQKTAMFRKWKQDDQGKAWHTFAKSAQPTIGCAGAIVVQWCSMWLCIETDGYCHT